MATVITEDSKYIVPVGYVEAINHFRNQLEMDRVLGADSFPQIMFRLGVLLNELHNMDDKITLYKEPKNEN